MAKIVKYECDLCKKIHSDFNNMNDALIKSGGFERKLEICSACWNAFMDVWKKFSEERKNHGSKIGL